MFQGPLLEHREIINIRSLISIQIFKTRKSIPAYTKKLLQIVVGQQKITIYYIQLIFIDMVKNVETYIN